MSDDPSFNAETPNAAPDSQAEKPPQPEQPKPKDRWDKLGIVASLVISLASLSLGFWNQQGNLSLLAKNSDLDRQQREDERKQQKLEYDTDYLLKQKNNQTEQAAVIEKFLDHLKSNDPEKHIAEQMIARLGLPELVRNYAISEGDDVILQEVINAPPPDFETKTKQDYLIAINAIQRIQKFDTRRLEGTWRDIGGSEEYLWKFEVPDRGLLTIKRTMQMIPPSTIPGNNKFTSGHASLRKAHDQWVGILIVGSQEWSGFTLTPENCELSGVVAPKCRYISTNRGFHFERVETH